MSETQRVGVTATINANYLRQFLTSVKAVTQEVKLIIDQDGIRTQALDPANVALVRAELDAKAFQSLAGEATIGVNIRRILNILTTNGEIVGNASTVKFTYDPNTDTLDLVIGSYRYTYACLDPDNIRKAPTLPNMDLAFVADMSIADLQEPVQWFDRFTDHIRIGYDPDVGEFWFDGMGESDDGCCTLDCAELESVHDAGHADSKFALDYFTDLVEPVPDDTSVRVEVGEEFPMTLSYGIASVETAPGEDTSYGEVEFMQGPRVKTD